MPKNKVKLNDKQSNRKNKQKIDKYVSDESKQMRNFLIILFSIIIIVLIVYGISNLLIKDDEPESEDTTQTGEIDYDKVSIGTMLNRNYKEYYVALYDAEDPQAVVYSAIITKYLDSKNATKVFFCDLGNPLNAKYHVGEGGITNPDAKTISDLALGDLTLIKVTDGEIVEYHEGLDAIKTEFNA